MLRMGEVNGVDHQAMQHMLTPGAIDWHGLGAQIACEADALLDGDKATLIIDESGFTKKDEASAGVARQWDSRLGKVDNCQVGVFANLCRDGMASLIDAHQRYQSKCEIALSMIEKALQHGVRFGYVAIDAGYGKDAAFLWGVDNLGCTFVADVHCKQMIYLEDPAPHIPDWNGGGRRPTHLRAKSEAIRVDQWASEQSDTAWRRIKLREGEKARLKRNTFIRAFGYGTALSLTRAAANGQCYPSMTW